MLLNVLDRPPSEAQPGGCAAVRQLLTNNHETRKNQRKHIRRAISIYRSLRDAEVLEELDTPDAEGRMVRVTLDLQDDFALNQPLSLFALEVIESLDTELPDHALNVLSVIEAVLENPGAILAAQLSKAKTDLISELKREGVEYDDRMERLEEVEYPKPLKEELYTLFNEFRTHHPWVGGDTVKPKSVVRELYERCLLYTSDAADE